MWPNFDGRAYTRDQFAAHVASLTWRDWKPKGITLHNTALPTLKMWAEEGPKRDQRITNLQRFYEVERGWKSGGPHLFVSRRFINGFSNLLAKGVHASCFNSTHIGIEMAGDFDSEEFDTGDGALVRDNAVFAMAVICRKLGLDPNRAINFHKDCPADHHDCPGKKVSKPDIVYRVQQAMKALDGGKPLPTAPEAPPAAKPASPAPEARKAAVARLQQALADLGGNPGDIDGIIGKKTRDAAKAVLGI